MAAEKVPLELFASVAPTLGDEVNRLTVPLVAVGSVPIDDVRFEFASSFLLPDAARPFARLATLRTTYPGGPVAIFGHADPTGDEAFNKKLSGRRARAVYGLLIRDTDIWEDLYQNKLGEDDWQKRPPQIMLESLGFDPGPIDGNIGPRTQAATKQFQAAKGLPESGTLNKTTRVELFTAYMDSLCVDSGGAPFTLLPEEFLGRNAGPENKADFQGCGENNPLLVFSRTEDAALSAPNQKVKRNYAHAPNRRVTVHVFAPGTVVDNASWPCPNYQEGPDGCRASFWNDAAARTTPGPTRRLQRTTHDTYGCRHYERVTLTAPPDADAGVGAGRVRATWSKSEVLPDRNKTFPPAVAPLDVTPDDSKVSLLVDVVGIAEETVGRIEIRHAESNRAVPGGVFENLVVRAGKLLSRATGAPPEWTPTAAHQPYEEWRKPFYYFVATVGTDVGESSRDFDNAPEQVLRVRHWHISVADAIADTPAGGGLSTEEEMDEIADLHSIDPERRVGTTAFNQAVFPVADWGSVLRNSYGYHHASHGDVRCRVDGAQFLDDGDSTPTVCPLDPTHAGRSVVFLGDVALGDAEVSNAADVPSTPRYLVYFDTCVAGWEPSFADAMIARGTQNVIAFRKYIPDGDAREMARQFYRKWIQIYLGDPGRIASVFFSVAPPFFDSMRPVLFGAGGGAAAPAVAAAAAVGAALGA